MEKFKLFVKGFYSYYDNTFKKPQYLKRNKSISYVLKYRNFYIIEIYFGFEINLYKTEDFHELFCGRFKIKHKLSRFTLTLFSYKYYLLYADFPSYRKDFTIFRDMYARWPERWISIWKIKQFLNKIK